jgi:hypothetical protein
MQQLPCAQAMTSVARWGLEGIRQVNLLDSRQEVVGGPRPRTHSILGTYVSTLHEPVNAKLQ